MLYVEVRMLGYVVGVCKSFLRLVVVLKDNYYNYTMLHKE